MCLARLPQAHILAAVLLALAATTLARPDAGVAASPAPLEKIQTGLFPTVAGAPLPTSVAATAGGDVYVAYVARDSATATTFTNQLAWRPVYGSSADPGGTWVTTSLGTAPGVDDGDIQHGSDSPIVAALPGGGVVVVWNDENGIWIQTWDHGKAKTAAQRITTNFALNTSSPDISLAVDGTGRAYVAWTDAVDTATQLLAIRAADGTISGPVNLNTSLYPFEAPHLAVRADGGGMATWAHVNLGAFEPEVLARRFTTSDVAGPVLALGSLTHGTGAIGAEDSSVGIESATGRSIVTWFQGTVPDSGPTQVTVYASIIDAAGNVTGPRTLATNDAQQVLPQALGDAAGNLRVAYIERDQLHLYTLSSDPQRFLDEDITLSSPTPSSLMTLTVPGAAGPRALFLTTDGSGRAVPWITGAQFSGPATPLGTLPATGGGAPSPSVAMDGFGNAYSAFTRDAPSGGGPIDLELGIADGTSPSLHDVIVPLKGVAGTPVHVTAGSNDVVGPVTISWIFGDGATATGGSVNHTYAAAGRYAVVVKATDASGQSAKQTQSIDVAAAPPAPPSDPTDTATTPTTPSTPGTATTPTTSGGGVNGTGGKTPKKSLPPVPPFKVAMLARGHKVIGLILVNLQRGSKVVVLCHSGCGRRGATLGRANATAKAKQPRVKRALRVGAIVEVRVSAAGRVTRYARFTVLRHAPYARRTAEGCLGAASHAVAC